MMASLSVPRRVFLQKILNLKRKRNILAHMFAAWLFCFRVVFSSLWACRERLWALAEKEKMKAPRIVKLLTAALLLAPIQVRAQWQRIGRAATEAAEQLARDRKGFFYYAEPNGNIHKLDTLGQEVARYSPRQPARPTNLDAWQNLRVYLFSENLQQFRILDRFLAETRETPGRFPQISYVQILAPDNEGHLWLVDGASRLLHYDPRRRQILQQTPLQPLLPYNGMPDFVQMRFYQNRLYLYEKSHSQLWVFDNMGNRLKTLDLPPARSLGFEGDACYYLGPDSIGFVPLYGLGGRNLAWPQGLNPEKLLYNGRFFYFFRGGQVYIYRRRTAKQEP